MFRVCKIYANCFIQHQTSTYILLCCIEKFTENVQCSEENVSRPKIGIFEYSMQKELKSIFLSLMKIAKRPPNEYESITIKSIKVSRFLCVSSSLAAAVT